jgi:murein DD-endopeptidase MepM/ murein hydrolase activator NlpD
MKQRQKNNQNLLPIIGASLSSAFLLVNTLPANANTLGTLSIPSSSLPADAGGDINAAILNSSSKRLEMIASRTVTLAVGDTLAKLLDREGIAKDQREAALLALADFYDVSKLKAGDQVEMSVRGTDPATRQLVSLHVKTGKSQDLTVIAGSDGVFRSPGKMPTAPQKSEAAATPQDWSVGVTTRHGAVSKDLKSDLVASNVPESIAEDVVSAFTYDPDMPEHPAKGSKFAVVYESASAKGAATSYVLRYAQLSVYGQEHRIYRYETNDGTVAFVEPDGRGVMPIHLGAPVRDAKMTSPWGWRVHPVLKVRKFHKGVDFAAPKGTPVYAAEDGVVQDVGWRGNYGRYVKVDHNERLATAYAHLAKFAPGLHVGSHVRKGQVIAYIGASGLATGNHLYYEVLVDNKQVDPLQNIMVQVNLDGSSLVKFQSYVTQLSQNTTTQP